MIQYGLNMRVFKGTLAWANSALSNTAQTLDVPLPVKAQKDAKYLVVVLNPSADTALDVSILNTIGTGVNDATPHYPEVKKQTVLVSTPEGTAILVEGFLIGTGGRIKLSNPTAVGAAGAFTAEVQVWAI